ncbi:adenosylmethionine decarboxylase [Candidatus Alkanophaga liquidiphilum]
MIVGTHIIAEFYECPEELLKHAEAIKAIMDRAIEKSGLKKVGEAYYQFKPHGASGVILLSSSHISIHTWPELRYASLDIYSCESADKAKRAFDVCIEELKPQKIIYKEMKRGLLEFAADVEED